MRVLQIIHGYPPIYNAGSEIYTQTLCRGLANSGCKVCVFSREENPFTPDYALRKTTDPGDHRITNILVNMARDRDRFVHSPVDNRVKEVISSFDPDVVHLQHLNHLSLTIPEVIKEAGFPLLYTLHDFWLMCPRGQFLQQGLGQGVTWPLCTGQDPRRCASICYSRYHRGLMDQREDDLEYWTSWIDDRMQTARQMVELIDVFIAPSPTLYRYATHDFGIPESKVVLLDYGFHTSRLVGRRRLQTPTEFTFGYIGTHIPAKGIQLLIQAFGSVDADSRLIIWGRERAQNTTALKIVVDNLPEVKQQRIEWRPEYINENIVEEVFNFVDVIVVPSIWLENSPLVIHEAQQARLPVITADVGGMNDYVRHEVNGLLFRHRDPEDLARWMQRLASDPELAKKFGSRGYLHNTSGDIPDVDEHVRSIIYIYSSLVDGDFIADQFSTPELRSLVKG